MSVSARRPSRRLVWATAASVVLVVAVIAPASAWSLLAPITRFLADVDEAVPHLVVSELQTGGAGASDEFIELYNPGESPVALAGLEVVYVSSSGSTVSRRATWESGEIGPRRHLLLANAAGAFAAIADVLYSGGLSATGGSVAIRPSGASKAIDAVGWGSASNAWMEGAAAPAPAWGSSLERLPGGEEGSRQDSDNNLVDFRQRAEPDPQNTASPATPATPTPSPISSGETQPPSATPGASPGETDEPSLQPSPPSPRPSPSGAPTPGTTASASASGDPLPTATSVPSPQPTATETPTVSVTPDPTATPTPSVTPTPTPSPAPIAVARALPDGSRTSIVGTALTSSQFTDGGGYVVDETAGIAVLVADGAYERGELLRVEGILDDRYHQRTLRADGERIERLGSGEEPDAVWQETGTIGEQVEGRLVQIEGEVVGPPTELSSGMAFEVDDGSGPARVLVGFDTGIDTGAWEPGARVELVAVVGQRDSSGTGTAGYRVQPRDADDVIAVTAAPSETPSPTPVASEPNPSPTRTPRPTATPTAAPAPALVTIARARSAASGSRVRVRGVVIAEAGRLADEQTAVIQDATGGLLLRLTDDRGFQQRGVLVEVVGTRATRGGMLTLRTESGSVIGRQAEPTAARVRTGALSEALESELVVIRGVVASAPRRSSTGSISFTVDDGSGEARVFAFPSTRAADTAIARGASIEVRGVLGQETSGSQPNDGYRVWPRDRADVRVTAPASAGGTAGASSTGAGSGDDYSSARGGAGGADPTDDPGGVREPGDLSLLVASASPDAAARGTGTLVTGPWPELSVAGVLWDGERVVGIAQTEPAGAAVTETISQNGVPAVVDVRGTAPAAALGPFTAPLLEIQRPDQLSPARGRPAAPRSTLPPQGRTAWIRLGGRVEMTDGRLSFRVGTASATIEYACETRPVDVEQLRAGDVVSVEGLAGEVSGERVIVAPCGAIRPAPVVAIARPAPRSTTSRPEVDGRQSDGPPGDDPRPLLLVAAFATLLLLIVAGSLAWRRGLLQRFARSDAAEGDDARGGLAPDSGVPLERRSP